jgi:hypothetical protein
MLQKEIKNHMYSRRQQKKWGMYVHETNASETVGRDHITCGIARTQKKSNSTKQNGILHRLLIT